MFDRRVTYISGLNSVTGNLGNESGKDGAKAPILVVDDNKVNQKVMCALLDRLALPSEIANDGQEAIDMCSRNKYSVILMDCHMPVMDGFEATKVIRKLESAAGTYTPIIAVTAMAMAGDRERCIASGMDDYMSKPVDKELLKIKLNHWLREDVVYSSLKMARKYFRMDNTSDANCMADLLEFYGEAKIDEIIRVYLFETEDLLRRIEVCQRKTKRCRCRTSARVEGVIRFNWRQINGAIESIYGTVRWSARLVGG
jgi:CheY-like chemotaxis protein